MQAQAVLYLCSVPYLIATEIAATRQKGKGKKEGRKIRSSQRYKKNKPSGLGGFRAGFSYNLNSDKSRYSCTCRF